MRGNLLYLSPDRYRTGSIPACAGEPKAPAPSPNRAAVYPRVCGGTGLFLFLGSDLLGLSPRVRGNQASRVRVRHRRGSIPACAGEPSSPTPPPRSATVYPRVCGGTVRIDFFCFFDYGLSPRVRGNLLILHTAAQPYGSIPACAGEPSTRVSPFTLSQVYPRVCGGTMCILSARAPLLGLSPRVRGNLFRSASSMASTRSIPACAGEP